MSLWAELPVRAEQHLPEGVPELRDAEGVYGRVEEGVAHQQHHVQLEQRSVTLAVGVCWAHHDDDEVEKKWPPTHHKCPKQNGDSEGPSHVAAPPLLILGIIPGTGRQCRNLSGMDARQHEHVDIQEADNHQTDEEQHDEADHDELEVKEPNQQHSQAPAYCPDDAQHGRRALHRHDVMVSECMEDGDVTGRQTSDFMI